ncbi:hypothetical protein [Pseudonocardia sp.]|uniref:hypothetical protein n=1 Tax=Pseudonocardia sp. TaxID=60912 RepID=UPI003D0B90FA
MSDELLYRLLTDPVFLAAVGVALLVVLVVALVVVVKVTHAVKRIAARNAHLLDRARAAVATGPAREAAELRGTLRASVAETDRVMAGTDHALVSAVLTDQHRELGRLAAALDTHLDALARDPDARRVTDALPEARDWTRRLCDAAATIRDGVRRTAIHDEEVRALDRSTTDAAAALRAGVDFLAERVREGR